MPHIKTFGPYDEATYEQIVRCAGEDGLGVLCADNHLGYSQPIGGAVAYEGFISPSGVGFDIGCGNKAVRTELRYDDIADDLDGIMDAIQQRIAFGVGRSAVSKVEGHPVLDSIKTAAVPEQRALYDLAAKQLGTVGAGNHYVDLFRDENDQVWVGVHFGSRGFGHKTASGFLALAQGLKWGEKYTEGSMHAEPTLLDVTTDVGQAYIEAMWLAGEYAYAGRDVVVDEVLDILGATAYFSVHNHHNFAWRENHFGREVWVVRKGCTPAFPGQQGFVGGSMGDVSVILEGTDDPENAEGLYSTVHGAGRVMSRTEAAGKVKKRWYCRSCGWIQGKGQAADFSVTDGEGNPRCPSCLKHDLNKKLVTVAQGRIDWPTVREELAAKNIVLRGGAADEAPGAYKRLPEVLKAHGDTIRILNTLTPIGVAMAGADTWDPYKD